MRAWMMCKTRFTRGICLKETKDIPALLSGRMIPHQSGLTFRDQEKGPFSFENGPSLKCAPKAVL